MFGIGFEELLIILVIVLILFGGSKLPELSRSIAQSMREIRKGFSGEDSNSSASKESKKEDDENSEKKS